MVVVVVTVAVAVVVAIVVVEVIVKVVVVACGLHAVTSVSSTIAENRGLFLNLLNIA